MKLLIHAGTVITANESDEVRHNQGVLVEDGRIKAVDAWGAYSPDDSVEVIDAARHTLLPGLIDAHIHITMSGEPTERLEMVSLTELPATTALKSAMHARRHVEMGVTTVRVLGSPHWVDIALRDAIATGWYPGPRMVCAGKGITSTGGHMDRRKSLRVEIEPDNLGASLIADGPAEGRRAAWTNLMHGADVIKINATLSEYVRALGGQCGPELSLDTMTAICEVAHGAQRRVAAHCHGGQGVDWAIEAGVDTFEHGRFLTDEQLDRMAAGGRFLVPTLSPEARRVDAGVAPGSGADQRWFRLATEAMYDTVDRAHRHGVPVAAGSDVGMPHVRHGEVAYEMEHLARAGLSNLDAIAAGTRIAARVCDLGDELGQIRPGFAADLLLVAGDLLQDFRLLQDEASILLVMQSGHVAVDRTATHQLATADIA